MLAGQAVDPAPQPLMFKGASLHGIYVGSRAMFENMLKAMVVNHIKPIVNTVFEFDHAADAYHQQMAGAHFGKVVIRV